MREFVFADTRILKQILLKVAAKRKVNARNVCVCAKSLLAVRNAAAVAAAAQQQESKRCEKAG